MLSSRFRKRTKKGGFLPILIPVMNLFLLILPLVIQNAYLQKLTTVELQLPTLSDASGVDDNAKKVMIDLKQASVAVYLEDKLVDDIPLTEGFENRLLNRLVEIKKILPTKNDILLKIDPQIKYEQVIKVIDQCKKDNKLFSEVVYFDEEK